MPRSFDVKTTTGLSLLMYVPVKSPSAPALTAVVHSPIEPVVISLSRFATM